MATEKDINDAIFIMSSLSPKVRDSIETESYREVADSDGATDQYILEYAFVEFIKDLDTIGITLTEAYSDVVSDVSQLHPFLSLMTYIMPNSLYTILKTNPRIKACVMHLLDGSSGHQETLLQSYLSELGGLDGQDALVPDMVDIIDRFYPVLKQTDIFTDTLRNQMNLVDTERSVIESTPEEHQTYRDFVRNLVGRLSDAVNLFSEKAYYDRLCRYQDIIIRDLIAPVHYTDYRYLFLESPETLPDDLHESFTCKWYHYKVSHPWCLEYYSIRMAVPDVTHQVLMYCFLYAVNPTRAAFNANNQDLRSLPFPDGNKAIIAALYQE